MEPVQLRDKSSSSSSYVVRESTTFETSPRPASFAHSVVITRTSGSSGTPRSKHEKSSRVSGESYQPFEEGKYVSITTAGVTTVKDSREQEKKDMQDLNSRFANYLDRVRTLEGRNKDLADSLEKLKTKWGKETAQIKVMFQAELDEARNNLDEALKEKAKLEIKTTTIEEEIEFVSMQVSGLFELAASNNEKFRYQTEKISDYEREIEILRRTIVNLENEKLKNRDLISKLEASLSSTRQNLDEETLGHVDMENKCQTIQEEIEFLKRLHEQEMKELAGLIPAGATSENRDFWRNEMMQAIKEIQDMYEDKMTTIRSEMESRYTLKLDDFKHRQQQEVTANAQANEDSAKFKNELIDLRNKLSQLTDQSRDLEKELIVLRRQKEQQQQELELRNSELRTEAGNIRIDLDNILKQLAIVVDTKLNLELEIAAYRKLLEGEENRINSKFDADSMHLVTKTKTDADIYSTSSGEMRAKTTFQTTAKGSLAISECSPDGYCVIVENKGKKVESLVGWKINRTVDGKSEDDFVFDEAYEKISPGKKIRVWAHGKKPRGSAPLDTEAVIETWGIGSKVITKLLNPEGEERATHNQQTVYTR